MEDLSIHTLYAVLFGINTATIIITVQSQLPQIWSFLSYIWGVSLAVMFTLEVIKNPLPIELWFSNGIIAFFMIPITLFSYVGYQRRKSRSTPSKGEA